VNPTIVIAAGFAVLFHRMAAHEHLSAWAWAIASFALSLIVTSLWAGFMPLMLAQLLLLGVLWWYNMRRVGQRGDEWAARREEERRVRQERMRRAQEEIERDRQRHEE
jgi:membrane protein implicated in regulation of membrane protease activity